MQIRASKIEYGILRARESLYHYGENVATENWQGDTSPFEFLEVLNMNIEMPMCDNLEELTKQSQPFLPWAEEHFLERVGGEPLNPPPSHANWLTKSEEYMEEEKFSHSYPERMWSKGLHKGIRFEVGDLSDAVELLKKDKYTRQCYIPIFFPEDLGAAKDNHRIPCTLGWHLIIRGNKMHCHYPMRSCDAVRHFHNDIYFANRLVMWMIEQINEDLEPGAIMFTSTSFHCFQNDKYALAKLIGE